MAQATTNAAIEAGLHIAITEDAKKAGISFSEQVSRYKTAANQDAIQVKGRVQGSIRGNMAIVSPDPRLQQMRGLDTVWKLVSVENKKEETK